MVLACTVSMYQSGAEKRKPIRSAPVNRPIGKLRIRLSKPTGPKPIVSMTRWSPSAGASRPEVAPLAKVFFWSLGDLAPHAWQPHWSKCRRHHARAALKPDRGDAARNVRKIAPPKWAHATAGNEAW